jgi:YD repeat-containing protein
MATASRRAGRLWSTFGAELTGAFLVTAPGDVTLTIASDDGFILGIGNGATRVGGILCNPPAKATPQGTLTYTYHANSLVASVIPSNANGVNIGYANDTVNRLSSVTDNNLPSRQNQTVYDYDDAGNLLSSMYPNGVVHSYTPDVNSRIQNLAVTKPPTTLASYAVARKFTGHITGGIWPSYKCPRSMAPPPPLPFRRPVED